MADTATVLLDSSGGKYGSSWRFSGYVRTISALDQCQVVSVFAEMEQAVAAGLYAAGFVSYEAAVALNPELPVSEPMAGMPLVWFALFTERHSTVIENGSVAFADPCLEPLKDVDQYCADVARIRQYIAAGDCYQVNFTLPLQARCEGDLRKLYRQMVLAQQGSFSAYIESDDFTILSASPELFFSLTEGVITTRPMKGTARRGRGEDEDRQLAAHLTESAKERAENVMIVDLLRNDLGKVAETGTVSVDALFEIETYPTVHQMTSTISAKVRAGITVTELFRALFPCGSVTGAPKRRSMEIIRELEGRPRGVYCGAIGFIAPGDEALFSVAIRTIVCEPERNIMTMGVGSAVTWDSDPAAEYAECLGKGTFLRQQRDFSLIESLRLQQGCYFLLERHLERLAASARYWRFLCDRLEIRRLLEQYAVTVTGLHKVRLLLAADGSVQIGSELLTETVGNVTAAISCHRVVSHDPLLYHKTTCRDRFVVARSARPDCDDVLFLNERGEVTEGSYHSLVIKKGGRLFTPLLSSGLLPGVLRGELLATGAIGEAILAPEDLLAAEEIWLINSVRGWRPCILI